MIYVHFASSKKTYIFRKMKNKIKKIEIWLCMFVCMHSAISEKMGQLLYQRIIQPFFRNTRTFQQGGGYSDTYAWWEGSAVMTPVFVIVNPNLSLLHGATRSDWPPISAEKNQFVSITFCFTDTWSNLNKF